MSKAHPVIKGSCNCGNVKYRIVGKHKVSVNCHCRDCQEAHGSPYTHCVLYQHEQVEFTVVDGSLGSFNRRGTNKRMFCRNCGCPVCSNLFQMKLYGFFPSSAREGAFPPPAMHIYTKEAAVDQTIPDDGLLRKWIFVLRSTVFVECGIVWLPWWCVPVNIS